MSSALLDQLYLKYDIDPLSKQHGKISDQLGDLYEEYILKIFHSKESLLKYQNNKHPIEEDIINKVLASISFSQSDIRAITSSKDNIPLTSAGGTPKTDVILNIIGSDDSKRLVALNIKHSSKPKVSVAEYDVKTICSAVGIQNDELISLMTKHQEDQSAKNFTQHEKNRMKELLKPFKAKLVRWCLTLSPVPMFGQIAHPEIIIRFKVINQKYQSVNIKNIEQYVNECIGKGSGFGTGLSWTYATGSAGKKIQFKG